MLITQLILPTYVKRLILLPLLLPLACGLLSGGAAPGPDTPTPAPAALATAPLPASPTPLPNPSPTALPPTATPLPSQPAEPPASASGTVSGRLCFPSEGVPPLILYFQNMTTQATVELATPANQTAYTVDLPPGEYIAYAWLPDATMGGSYSPAVPCGLSVECTDHQPLPFQVEAGQTTAGIDLCDWYGQPGEVPTPPANAQAPATSTEPAAATMAEPGLASGSICYPSSRTPPMTLYVENVTTQAKVELDIGQGQTSYTLELPPGEYMAYAQTVGTELAGFYSQAVPCGLGTSCTDHRPLPFRVNSHETTAGIDLCDWYNPPGLVSAQPGQTPDEGVRVTTLQKVHVFAGPGLDYPTLGAAPARALARAVGRNQDSSWLQVEYPAVEGGAWIYTPLLQVIGQPEVLPLVTVAPAITEQVAQPKLAPSTDQFSPAAWGASFNDGIVHFKGYIRDEAGRPVNGFSILADNGTWSVLTHPTGASRHYPDTDDGEWDLVISNATDAVGWWTLTVVSYDCPGFEEGFNAQCKLFTRLSENQVVKIVYPDEAIITADWVCRRDCDQGLYVQAYRR